MLPLQFGLLKYTEYIHSFFYMSYVIFFEINYCLLININYLDFTAPVSVTMLYFDSKELII